MDLEFLQSILTAIKNNDFESFSKIVETRRSVLSLRFGRFPMLSVCYLYQSDKIISAYETNMMNVVNYIEVDELNEIYIEFKDHAKKCMRFYTESDAIVSPLEMLAIINDSYSLRNVYGRYPKNEEISVRLTDIYRILHRQNIKQEDKVIYIKRQKLPKKQAILVVAIIVAIVMLTSFFGVFYTKLNDFYGAGTEETPIVLRREEQLKAAVEKGSAHFVLAKDMVIGEPFGKDFVGDLDGNGHTLTINCKLESSFISTLKGTISNITINIVDQNITLLDNFAFLINNNEGIIENVSVNIKAELNEEIDKDELYASVLCLENTGTITDSKINAEIKYVGDGIGNAYFSAFVAKNNGTISRCSLSAESAIIADTIDLAGIAIENGEKGKISYCNNYGIIEQNTINNQWNPNCAGMTMTNKGIINNCLNQGKISASSQTDNANCSVYLGGLVAINYGKISKSKSVGELVAKTNVCNIYVGGIVSLNASESATIESCGEEGVLSIESPSQWINMFMGGIASGNAGTIKDCFFVGKMVTDNKNALLCYLVGLIANESFSNNIALKRDNIPYWGAFQVGNYIYIYDQGSVILDTIDEVKLSEVYW